MIFYSRKGVAVMQKEKLFLPLLLVGMTVLAQGCAVAWVGAGAGTVIYAMGDLEAVVAKDINAVYQATLKALEQLEFRVSSKVKDALAAKIIARDAQDKKITIKLASTAEDATKLNIRIGLFGNETKSRLIYEQIQKSLQ